MDAQLSFSTNKQDLNIGFITEFLSTQSYWAAGRSENEVRRTIDNSFCVGVFENSKQIGFARVVTDYQTLAYIMDVFISPEEQNRGIGAKLMEFIVNAPEFAHIKRFTLKTVEAEGFYKSLGFKPVTTENLILECRTCA